VFAVIVLNNDVAGGGLLAMTVVFTVTLSIFVHGLTANPLARLLGPRMESSREGGRAGLPGQEHPLGA
jgi:NhaP-type Na+/H+ or K+/H+ antiporter